MKEGRCPFLESEVVAYCKAFPVRKMIPAEAASREPGLCTSSSFRQCAAFREVDHREPAPSAVRGFAIRTDRLFHPRHVWAAAGPAGGEVRIGIDDFAARVIGPIDRLSLPPEGASLRENGVAFLAHSGNRTVRVAAPADGAVAGVNPAVAADPTLLNRDPFGEGWVLALRTTPEALRRLYPGSTATGWLEWEVERLHRTLALDLGLTATDGGESLPDIGARLNDAQWSRIVGLFLG